MSTHRAGTISPFEPLSDDALLSLESMEGLIDQPAAKKRASTLPGYAAAAAIAVISYGIHQMKFVPLSASILAIVVAVLVRNLLPAPATLMAGCKRIIRKGIPLAIVLTGAGLNLGQVAGIGWQALGIIVAGMLVATAIALVTGGRLGLMKKTALLIGTGTAVCGTSAIVAAAPLIEADDEDMTLSIGAVSLLGLILMFALPAAGSLLAMTQTQFGVWAGVSIHAVPQVVAAGFTYGKEAGSLATLVKLARVTLLAPFLLLLVWKYGAKDRGRVQYGRLVPSFLWGFLALAVLNTVSLIPTVQFASAVLPAERVDIPLAPWLVEAGNWVLTLAMAAIGLEVNLRLLMKVGGRAVLAGTAAMVALCATAWALIRVLF